MEDFLGALVNLTTGAHIFYLFFGVFLGFIVGILPGLGGIVGFSILLPFLYGMDTASALALLIGLVAVVPTSDTMTSVLLGIPGSSSSQATVMDGFPLAKQGHGARALSAAYFASLMGGIIGAIVLTVFVLVARPVILLMGSAELFMLGILGVSMVGMLSGDKIVKGLIACVFGLLLGTVGNAPATGEWRMTFDSFYLYDGIKLVLIGLAVFALPEIVELLAKGKSISERNLLGRGWLRGLRDTWIYRWLVLRCAGIGCLIGALPGLGGSVVDWIAYGHVVQSSKDKENFGKGDIRGVIAPESANNAKEGGALVPTLLFGIPGSGSMAIFLGGITLIGLEAGPSMVGDNIGYTYVIIWSLALANVLGTGLCIVMSPHIARLTRVPYVLLAPFILMIITFAAFQANKQYPDLLVLIGIGAFAILMKRGGWPRPALLIGFVLSDTLETYFYQAVQFYGWSFILRPGAIIILAAAILTVLSILRYRDKLRTATHESEHVNIAWRGDGWIVAMLGLFFAATLIDSLQHSLLGAIFPASVAAAGLLAAFIYARQFLHSRRGGGSSEITAPVMLRNLGWFVALAVLSALFGFVIAITVIFITVLRRQGGISWLLTTVLSVAGIGFMLTIAYYARMDFPWGVLQNMVELLWPLG
ncbi:MAG: tripartite tricarboxylate transporter permease [Gammaproteobacteria bacterium]